MASGVLAGAYSANQPEAAICGWPDSLKVGTSGSAVLRFSPEVASTRTLAFCCRACVASVAACCNRAAAARLITCSAAVLIALGRAKDAAEALAMVAAARPSVSVKGEQLAALEGFVARRNGAA